MDNKKSAQSGSILRKGSIIAALLLTAVSLSACIVPGPGYGGGGHRHHWNNDGDWNGGPGWQGGNWQGNGGGWQGGGGWNGHH